MAAWTVGLVLLQGCGDANTPSGDPVDDNWLAFFRRSDAAEVHLYLDREWRYRVVTNPPPRRARGVLSEEQQATIEMIFSKEAVQMYLSDSVADSRTNIGACEPSEMRPTVYSLSLFPDPVVGEVGFEFGCWAEESDLSEPTRWMIEQLDGLVQTLAPVAPDD